MTKRIRSANYTLEDNIILVDAVERHPIVNCRKTDAASNKIKAAEWDMVAAEINAATLTKRTGEQYRLKYDTLKRETRRRHAADKADANKTGGGVHVPLIRPGDVYYRIRDMHPVSVRGLPDTADSDGVAEETATATTETLPNADDVVFLNIEEDHQLYDETEFIDNDLIEKDDVKESAPVRSGPSTQLWDSYTPSMLRQQQHPTLRKVAKLSHTGNKAWASRRRPAPSSKEETAASVSVSKFSDLAACKAELAQLQMQVLKSEEGDRKLAFNNAEKRLDVLHEIEVKIKLIQQEEAATKLAISKAQLAQVLSKV